MNRLQSELNRLYLARPSAPTSEASLVGASGTVRAMVMELACPPGWEALAKVWQGVQAELDLPAPAIAVSGLTGMQLWFSLAEPLAAAQAHAFLEQLRQRFVPDVDPRRVRLLPTPDATAQQPEHHAPLVPAQQLSSDNWSAFVAPDLAPVFADTPWLDIPPSEDGQAALLQGLKTMSPAAFADAMAQLSATARVPQAAAMASSVPAAATVAPAAQEAEQFLLQIMRDATVATALRIEAAKALLPGPRR